MTDEQLLADGKELQNHYQARLLEFARQRLPELVAAEVVQESLRLAQKHAARFDPEQATLTTWIFCICNRSIVAMKELLARIAELEAEVRRLESEKFVSDSLIRDLVAEAA